MGGLAYDLTTKLCRGFVDWNLLFTQAPNQLLPGDFMVERWQGIGIFEATTGNSCFDVRIRGTTYVNDNYLIYGSYRAEFRDLYGLGNHGIAWDGFVMVIPAWNIHARWEAGVPPDAQWQQQNGFYVFPCRMPYTLPPAAADSVAVNNDSTPGVYGVSGLMGSNEVPVVEKDACASFYYVGHQRTYAANGTLTGQDYVGAGGIVLAPMQIPSPVDSGPLNFMDFSMQEQFGWGLTTAIAGTGMNPLGEWIPKFAYAIEDYSVAFQIPTGVIVADLVSGRDYYISRIYSIASLTNNDGASPTPLSNGAAMICGEVVKDDGAGAVDYSTVMTGLWHPQCSPDSVTGYAAGNYGIIRTGTDENFGLEDGLPTGAYNLQGAYAVAIQPGLQKEAFDGIENFFTVGINNVTHGGNPYCELYIGSVSQCLYGNGYPLLAVGALPYIAVAFACQGGTFTTGTGLALPITGSKWTGVATQQSTFDPQYEIDSKGQAGFLDPIIPEDEKFYILDEDLASDLTKDPTIQGTGNEYLANALCGVCVTGNSGNINIRGLSNKTPPTPTDFYSNVAYGWLAHQPADEPYVLMYDWASWRVFENFPQTNPPTWGLNAAGSPEGTDMNDNFTIDPNSTTRYPLSASWDNDRDQWIFGFADATNGFGVMSVNSAFSNTSITQLSFLDQTDDYAIPAPFATPEASIHTARLMTPILDGLTIIAETNDLTDPGSVSLRPYITNAGTPDQITTFLLYTINGTTGRRANVWVDYLLFDGVDSMIALELQKLGLRVNVENVEWYRAKLLRKGHLGLTSEEIEDWMRQQQDEYKATQRLKERQGRQRIKRRQVAAWKEGLEDNLKGEFLENGGYDSLKEFDEAAAEYVPNPLEESPDMNRDRKNKSTKRKNKR